MDPHLKAQGGVAERPVAQVVMPIKAFMITALFFQRALEGLVKDGTVRPEWLEEAAKAESEAANGNGNKS
jgi:hypothetical protein